VALAILGVWFFACGLSEIALLMDDGRFVLSTAIYMVVLLGFGAGLLFGRERLAGILLPGDEEDSEGPPLDQVVLSALMIAGACLCISGAWRVARMVAYVIENDGLGATAWTEFAPHLLHVRTGGNA
jgi:hypothetical protein